MQHWYVLSASNVALTTCDGDYLVTVAALPLMVCYGVTAVSGLYVVPSGGHVVHRQPMDAKG
jgi:hypothetical protein